MQGGTSSFRRRRVILYIALFIFGLVLYYSPWELPASVKESGLSGRLSRANIAQLTKVQKEVDEIYGLLHLVTSDMPENEHILSSTELDPTKPIDWSVYAAGEPKIDWVKEAARIDKVHPIIVFSKTYCPYSRKAKALLASYDISPPPKVVEVDVRDDGNVLKQLLTRLTDHSTFPNIIIQGKTIGGSDNLNLLHSQKELRTLIEKAGAKARKSGLESD
ncbi:hypothetical protein H1R20_g6827, partial [Candolleomyces eurysporus]